MKYHVMYQWLKNGHRPTRIYVRENPNEAAKELDNLNRRHNKDVIAGNLKFWIETEK